MKLKINVEKEIFPEIFYSTYQVVLVRNYV